MKKYNTNKQDKEEQFIANEPEATYYTTNANASRKKPSTQNGDSPCMYTVEEMREKFDRAVQQAEAGEVMTHEEMKKRYAQQS